MIIRQPLFYKKIEVVLFGGIKKNIYICRYKITFKIKNMRSFLKALLEILCWLVGGFGIIILFSYPIYFFFQLAISVRSFSDFIWLNLQGFVVFLTTCTIIALANYIFTKIR